MFMISYYAAKESPCFYRCTILVQAQCFRRCDSLAWPLSGLCHTIFDVFGFRHGDQKSFHAISLFFESISYSEFTFALRVACC